MLVCMYMIILETLVCVYNIPEIFILLTDSFFCTASSKWALGLVYKESFVNIDNCEFCP